MFLEPLHGVAGLFLFLLLVAFPVRQFLAQSEQVG
jgi:hypothetical protein